MTMTFPVILSVMIFSFDSGFTSFLVVLNNLRCGTSSKPVLPVGRLDADRDGAIFQKSVDRPVEGT